MDLFSIFNDNAANFFFWRLRLAGSRDPSAVDKRNGQPGPCQCGTVRFVLERAAFFKGCSDASVGLANIDVGLVALLSALVFRRLSTKPFHRPKLQQRARNNAPAPSFGVRISANGFRLSPPSTFQTPTTNLNVTSNKCRKRRMLLKRMYLLLHCHHANHLAAS